MRRIAIPALALVAALGSRAAAQSLPTLEELARPAHQLAEELQGLLASDATGEDHDNALERCRQAMQGLVKRVVALRDAPLEYYVEVSSPLLYPAPELALRIVEKGLESFPTARFLWDHAAIAHTVQAEALHPGKAKVDAQLAAEAAFRKALGCTPDTFHAHLGIAQTLAALDRCGEALEQFELALQDEVARQAVAEPWRFRVGYLLRAGRAKDAITLLTGAGAPKDDDAAFLLLRAYALAADAKGVATQAAALQKAQPGPRALVAVADALAATGKKADALKLLATRPARSTFATEEERQRELWLQSATALETVLKTNDVSAKGPLRAALTKALEHKVKVLDASKTPPAETDLSTSPVVLGQALHNMPASPAKDWANAVLLALCVQAAPEHKPDAFEQQVLAATQDRALPAADDLPGVLLALRAAIGDPDSGAVLSGLATFAQVTAPPAPEKAPAKAPGKPAKRS